MRQAVAARRALSESVLAELRPSYPLLDQYKDWAVVNTEKVQWGDLDAFNHVNNCAFRYQAAVLWKPIAPSLWP